MNLTLYQLIEDMLDKVYFNNLLYAIIIRSNFSQQGIEFFTTNNDSQQLGYMKRDQGYVINPHRHNLVKREVHLTQEVLFIKSGKVRVDFYNNEQSYIKSKVLNQGDVILLSDGGHGFKMLEDSEIIEVQQGPYCGEFDKVRFSPIEEEKVNLE
jgi:hypothetical protein